MADMISTPTGLRDIAELVPGDEVLAMDGVTVNVIEEIEYITNSTSGYLNSQTGEFFNQEFYQINGNDNWRFYRAQSITTRSRDTVHFFELEIGDQVQIDGSWITITALDNVTGVAWWRLGITGDHTFIMNGLGLHNASRFLVSGGSGTWGNTNNWSATDGGASGASAPVNGDAVQFTTLSANANMDTTGANRAATSLVMTGTYAGTLTITNQLTLAGALTLLTNTAGSAAIIINTSATITSNSKTIGGNLTLQGASQTYTWADAPTITGTLTFNGSGTLVNSGAFTLTCGNFTSSQNFTLSGAISCSGTWTNNVNNNTVNGSFNIDTASLTSSNAIVKGTGSPTMSFSGTGTWTSNGDVGIPITNNGTLSLGTSLSFSGTTFTHASGTVTANGSSTNLICATNAITFTINSTGFASGDLRLDVRQNITFNGTNGATHGGIIYVNGAGTNRTITYKQGNTYTIAYATSNISPNTPDATLTIASSSATLAVALNWSAQAQFLPKCSATRVDSSGGYAVYVGAGTLTTTTNWNTMANSNLAVNCTDSYAF